MMKLNWILGFICLFNLATAQVNVETTVDVPAQNIGGKTEFEHVFNTQVQFPEELLKTKIIEDVTIYFTVLADGQVDNIHFKQSFTPDLVKETRRLLNFYRFEPALKNGVKVASESFLTFKYNAEAYKKICKNREFSKMIYSKEQPDTNFVIYDRADQSPEYIKGDEALAEFVLKELDYPPLAIKQNIQGTVLLSFVVETNGCVSNILVEKGVSVGCTEEAIRVLRLTKWKPAIKDGKLVRYKMKYPIIFNLKNVNRDNSMSEQR